VLSTVNIQHLESLNDVVTRITGAKQRETVPDEIVRRADQVELVDMTPEALRRRMAHGNVYPPERIDAALGNYFRAGNLTALRELALLWLADTVDDELDRYRAEQGIAAMWEARERVVVALTGGPEGDTLVRRAARIADRSKGADLYAVHVARDDGLTGADPALLSRQRLLVESLGGTYHEVVGGDVPAALLDFARGVNATQLVLGVSRRGGFARVVSPGVSGTVIARSGPIDVHLVTHDEAGRGDRRLLAAGSLTARRRIAGWVLALAGVPLLTALLLLLDDALGLPSDLMLFLGMVVATAIVGGRWPALVAAGGGFLLLNWFFTPPVGSLTVGHSENLLALVVFLVVAVSVSAVVDLADRRSRQAAQAGAEARILATVAGGVLRGARPLTALLERLLETFALRSVTLLERRPESPRGPDVRHDPSAWVAVAAVGDDGCRSPDDGDVDVVVDETLSLVLCGRPLAAADRRTVEAFAAQAAVALRQERLAADAARAKPLAEADKLRTALLAAVSHDLRTPLSSAKAAVTSLRSHDVEFTAEDRDELLATADESLDRLDRLVANLLDMSRLQAGALGVEAIDVDVADIVARVLGELGQPGRVLAIAVPDDLPAVRADPGLVERVLVNVVANALRHSPPSRPPLVTASAHGAGVQVRVVDHGPGIPDEDRDRVFLPFQRLGDRDNHTGVGLGLALSRGLAEAMGGTLEPESTPGGGLTMVLTLPAASAVRPVPEAGA
jgi:two-component system sensor histidine kinase KdpD